MLSNRALMARSRQQPLEHRLLLTATFCLLAGGAVMVYSASSARTLLEGHGDGTAYLVKYLMYGAVGLVVMQLLVAPRARARPPLHARAAARRVRAAACSSCCPASASTVNGARRWLGAGPLQFQPAEVMKLALVLHAAAVLSARPKLAPQPARRRRADLPARRLRGAADRRAAATSAPALVIGFTLAAMLVAAGLPLRQLAAGGRRRRAS